jgi:ribonucleoside-triphosphate reductase
MENEGPICKHCGSTNVYGISRVVGFFSKIEDWNKSKKAEFKDRQKGTYNVIKKESEEIKENKIISEEE